MNERNLILRAAVLASLGAVAGQANAQVDLTSPTAVKFASELPITSTTTLALTNAGSALNLRVPTVSGLSPSATKPMYLKVFLSNGAKFTAAPTLSCSGATAGGDATSYSGGVTFGGANNSNVTFTVVATDGVGGSGASAYMTGASGCVVVANVTVSGSLSPVNVSATFEYTNGAVSTVSGLSGAYITFARGFSAAVSANTASNLTVDAINGATRFTAGGPAITSASAILGYVQAIGNGTAFSANGAATISAGDVMTAATLTVAGNAIGAAIAANGSSGVFLSNLSSCGSVDVVVANSAASSVTFNITAANLTQLSAVSGLTVCANMSGNASQVTTGQLTATLSGATGVSNVTVDLSAGSSNLVNVNQNGSSMNAYFINASTSTNKTSVVRIVNNNSKTANIKATAYAEDGTVLGTASASVGSAAANSMLSLTSADLETKLGFTPAATTTKYRVLFTGDVSGFKVVNFIKDVATGNLTLGQQQDN